VSDSGAGPGRSTPANEGDGSPRPDDPAGPGPAAAAVVNVEGLQVRYRNGAIGVVAVDLQVADRQFVAVFGPNGAGKTTTMRAISGFLRGEKVRISGSVEVLGHQVAGWEPHRISKLGLAFIPERRKIFPNLSVAQNLAAVGRRPSRAQTAELHERIFGLFPDIKDRRSEAAGRLSGGQRQMVAIGRGLMCQPRVLIVDELTLGLHHGLHGALYEAMRKVADTGTAVIVVDESTGAALEFVDHCYLLGTGVVKDSGGPAKFRGSELLAAGYVEAG
jgi:branched-chain amino acid transport system ATP-binding protein